MNERKGNKIKVMVAVFLGLFLLQTVSMLDFGQAKLTSDEDDLSMDIWGSFSTSSNEIVGSGEAMGLGTYKPNTPNVWYREPSATSSDFEFSNMQMDFAKIHSPIYSRNAEANFSKAEFLGNETVNSSNVDAFNIASGEVGTYVLDTYYNYSYAKDNVSDYDTDIGTNNGTAVSELETCFDGELQLNTTGNYRYYADTYGITYTSSHGQTGAGSLSNTRTDDGNSLRIDANRKTTDADAGEERYTINDGVYKSWKVDSSWADNDDGNEISLHIQLNYELPYDIDNRLDAEVRADIDIPTFYTYTEYKIDYSFDIDTTLEWGGVDTRYVKLYIRHSDGSWEKIDETTSENEVDGSFSFLASQLSTYNYNGEFQFSCDGVLESDYFGSDKMDLDIAIDRLELTAYQLYKVQAKVDYPNVDSGYRLYYDITASYSGTPTVKYLDIGGSKVDLTAGTHTNYIDSSGVGKALELVYTSTQMAYFYIDYLLVYDREYDMELEHVFEFDYTNKTSIDNIYNVSLRYYTNATSDLFMLQYGTDNYGDMWTNVGYLTASIPTHYTFLADHSNPYLRVIADTNAYEHEAVICYKIVFDCINLTSKYEPFLHVWANHSYEIASTPYNELVKCAFGTNYNYNWEFGNVSYVFDSTMFDQYATDITITSVLQQINYTFQIAFNMNISVNFTIKISSVEWKSSSDVDLTLNGEDVLPMSPNSACIHLYSYPSQLLFQASEDIRFNMSTTMEFYFSTELEIISRSHLQASITLTSDHSVDLERLRLDSDLEVYAVYLQGSTSPYTPFDNNSVIINYEFDPDETLVIDVYLEMYEDIYQELEYFFDYLGNGVYYTYLEGTLNTYMFVDKTKAYNWQIILPVGFELKQMKLLFSNMRYIPTYVSDPTNNTYDYGYYSPSYRGDVVEWYRDYYHTSLNFSKIADVGGSGNEIVYSNDFASESADMSHNYYPDNYNNMYSVNDYLAMQNTFPQEFYYDDPYGYTISEHPWSLQYEYDSNIGSLGGNDDPYGIEYVDNYIYVVDFFDSLVYKYDNKLTTEIDTYDISVIAGVKWEIAYYDSFFYITDGLNMVSKWTSEFTYCTSYDISTLSGGLNDDLFGITYCDNSFYLSDLDNYIYEYNSDFTALIGSYDISSFITVGAKALHTVNGEVYLGDFEQIVRCDTSFNCLDIYDTYKDGGCQWVYALCFVDDLVYLRAFDSHIYVYSFNFTLSSELIQQNSSAYPDQELDFTMNEGTIGSFGDLSTTSDYTEFNSTSNGEYNGTYSFTNQAVGTDPIGFSTLETAGSVGIIESYLNHRKVVYLDDNDANYCTLTQTFDTTYTSGIVEWWASTQNGFNIWLYGGASLEVYITMKSDGNIRAYNDAVSTDVCTYSFNTWYHFRVCFDTVSDTFSLYINGVLEAEFGCYVDGGAMSSIVFRTDGGESVDAYVDAIGYSWSSNYTLGDNLISDTADFRYENYHYPATYSFTDDIVGGNPSDWDLIEGGSSTVNIIENLDNHNKVLELFDTQSGTSYYASAKHYFSLQNYGTVEFWVRKSGFDEVCCMRGWNEADTNLPIFFEMSGGFFSYHDGVSSNNIIAYSLDTWYHVRIDFETTAGGYMGLGDGKHDIYIDNVHYVDNENMYLDEGIIAWQFNTRGWGTSNDYWLYVDAVGFSWDSDYTIGDNHISERGSGRYNGTYSFDTQLAGSNPIGWNVDESGGTVNVIDSQDGHSKIVKLYDNNAGDNVHLYQSFDSAKTSGTVEFWIYIEEGNAGDGIRFYLRESGTYRLSIAFNYGWDTQTSYYDGAWHQLGVNSYLTDQWNHIKIEFDCSSDWHLWMNGISMDAGAGFGYSGVPTNVDEIYFFTGDNSDVPTAYIDAIGYSWSDNYTIGDNYYEQFQFGDYPATYSFDTQLAGSNPIGWTSSEPASTSISIEDIKDGHNKIVKFTDTGANLVNLQQSISNRESGTIEFWFYITTNNQRFNINLQDGSATNSIYLAFGNTAGQISYYDGSFHDISSFSINMWYHIRIEFDLSSNWNVWLNNEIIGNNLGYRGTPTEIDIISFNSDGTVSSLECYIDAIGYSWSDIGIYNATYSFEENYNWIGSSPYGWVDGSGTGCTASINGNVGSHSQVLDIYDNSNSASCTSYNIFSSDIIADGSVIEFWYRTSDSSKLTEIRFTETSAMSTIVVYLRITGGYFTYWDGSGHNVKACTNDVYYHNRIVVDFTSHTFDWYIDLVLEGNDLPFSSSKDKIRALKIATSTSDTGYHSYFDAIDYSWDSAYSTNRNYEQMEVNYLISENYLLNQCELNATVELTASYELFQNAVLYYSYTSSALGQDISLQIWNYDLSQWDLLNSTDAQDFYLNNYTLNSSYVQNSASLSTIRLQIYGYNTTDNFSALFDILTYNLTYFAFDHYANLTKTIDFSFLNYYDIGFDDYLKLYNITIEFEYQITQDLYPYALYQFNMSYLADYSFFTELGLTEEAISWISSNDGDADCSVSVIREYDNHDYVLEFIDNNAGGQGIWSNTFSDQIGGNITFYIYFPSLLTQQTIELVDDGSVLAELIWEDDGKLYYDAGAGDIEIDSYLANHWYKICINFSQTTDTFDLWVDEILMAQSITLKGANSDGIDMFYVLSDVMACDTFYMDAIDYSWENEWTTFHNCFIFNSTDLDEFDLMFNISSGLIEIRNMNYTIVFECVNQYGGNEIYQYFQIEPVFSLDYLQQNRGQWYLNYTLNFTASSDYLYYNFTNSINNNLLLSRLWVEHEDGWSNVYSINTNSTFATEFNLNISQYLADLGKLEFKDFYLELYLAGNPSNCTLDDMVLYDYDHDFYEVLSCWIDDSIVVSTQNITMYWNATDRYISHMELNQTFEGIENMILNTTLTNNTLQSWSFFNYTNGVYYLNATFYDDYGNYEQWSINYTVISSISIGIAYQNPLFINTNNTISVNIMSESPIIHVYYDNSTDYVHEYDNSSYPIFEYEFNYTILKTVETQYNISVKAINEWNDTFYVNVSYICAIERTTQLDIHNLKNSYDQDDSMSVVVSLRDMYNLPIPSMVVNYTIEAPNGSLFIDTTDTTDSNGVFTIAETFSILWTEGWYHLNVSFNDTSGAYMGCWKMMSFEMTPILRILTNSTLAGLTVRNNTVGDDNNITIGVIHANSFDLQINNTGNLTFDLTIYDVIVNRSSTENYTDYILWDFEIEQSNSIFNRINFSNAYLYDVPKNFTYFYFDGLQSLEYTLVADNLTIDALIGELYQDGNSFEIQLRYLRNQQRKIQITAQPRTDSNSVLFNQRFYADDDYKFWYFKTTHTINSVVEMEHLRTGALIDWENFIVEEGKYKFYLGTVRDSSKTAVNDLFNATLDVDPNWVLSYVVNENNGTSASITISYSADLSVNNVILVLDLSAENLYMEDWSQNATQSLRTFSLEVPLINFTTSIQAITISGTSDTPLASFDDYKNEDTFKISDKNWKELNEYYKAYFSFYKYSQVWIINDIDTDWELDGVHYGSKDIDVNADNLFYCTGWGASITTAYLRIKANPISAWIRTQNDEYVEYKIKCSIPCNNIDFDFYIETDERVQIERINIEYLDHESLYSDDGKDYHTLLRIDLDQGTNIIRIYYRPLRLADSAWLLLIAGLALIGFVTIYLEVKHPEYLEPIKFWKKKSVRR